MRQEFKDEVDKIERIRKQYCDDLIKSGVSEQYLSEIKAVDVRSIQMR